MSEKDLPSGSDESDVDFIPENENHESLSEESGSSYKEESDGEKKKKKERKSRKRRKVEKEPEEEPVTKKKDVNVDALWAEFKDDVNKKDVTAKSSTTIEVHKKDEESENKKIGLNDCNVKKPVSSVLGKSFASSVNNKSAPKGGLASVLNKIGKKDKISTLEKSKLDWNKFKQSEGIDEEIKTFNRGKDGYLEKQDFLQRTDLRQFEIEKQLRATKKTFR